jgi:hypothetical protein
MSGLASRSVSQMAATLAVLGRKPAAFHLSDGRLVVSPFMTEAHAPAWWQQLMSTMSSTYGIRVALVPVFVDSEQNHAAAFKSISYGMGNWGSRNPAWNSPAVTYPTSPRGRIAKVRALGVKWMQPVSVQDERPRAGLFDEARNTDNLIDTWNVARLGHADWVQLTTWNDYTEGSQFAPSEKHGWTYLDISSYYLAWYKTGHAPKIRRNTVYVTHRTQFTSAKPSYPESLLMHLRGGSPARDDVQALTFLTHSAKVTITVGGVSHTCNVPAGVGRCLAPLRVGHVSVVVKRAGHTVTRVRSPYAVTANPYVQDLQYVGASSRRPKP